MRSKSKFTLSFPVLSPLPWKREEEESDDMSTSQFGRMKETMKTNKHAARNY